MGYLGLVGIGTWHAGVGMMKVVTWIRGPRRRDVVAGTEGEHKTVIPRRRRIGLRGILAAVLGVVSVGLVRMHGEGKGVSPVMTRRYEAVYARLPWSGLLR